MATLAKIFEGKRQPPAGKISKQAVLYVFRPEVQYTCNKCVFNKEPGKCAVFGENETIKPYGGCNFFLHSDPKDATAKAMPYLGLVTKLEAGYAENKPGFSCKRCEYFLPAVMDCRKVDKDSDGDTPGQINPNACCNAWEADD